MHIEIRSDVEMSEKWWEWLQKEINELLDDQGAVIPLNCAAILMKVEEVDKNQI